MASIRKVKKRLKRELRARKVLHGIIDDSLHGVAVKHQSEWLIATTEFELEILKSRRSFCAFQKRMERKIRKDGKWKEFCALKQLYLHKKESPHQPPWMDTQSQIEKYEDFADKTYTMPDNPDPKFYRDMLIKLFVPSEYDNPEGRKILGEEIDKAIEELKKKIEDEA